MKIFPENTPTFVKIVTFCTCLGLVIGALSYFKNNVTNIFLKDRSPNLIVDGNPKIGYSLTFKVPNIPEYIVAVDTSRQITDSSSQQSVVFDVYEKKIRQYVKLEPDININIDSIVKSQKYTMIDTITPKLKIEFKIKNIGKRAGQIIFISMLDTTSYVPLLRDIIFNQNFSEDQVYYGNLDDSVAHQLLPDSTLTHSEEVEPVFLDKDNNFILHLYIIYRDVDSNYYDLYYWIKINWKPYKLGILPIPHYKQQAGGNFKIDKILFYYIPRKPYPKEIFEMNGEPKYEYERELTKDEVKTIKKMFKGKYQI